MSLILAFVAIVFLIIGFALIINGYLESPAVDKVVPIEDLESVEANLATSREQEKELKSRLDSMVLALDESRANAEKLPRL